MTNDRHILILSDGPWRLLYHHGDQLETFDIPSDADSSLSDKVHASKQQLLELDYDGQPILLALASSLCLSATIDTSSIERSGRRRSMGYQLEEHLPICVEDAVVDFVESPGEALGVCTEQDLLVSVIDALTASGIAVQHICPAAFLITSFAVDQQPDGDAVLITNPKPVGMSDEIEFDLIEMRKNRPVKWWWFAGDAEAANKELSRLSDTQSEPFTLLSVGSEQHAQQARKGLSASIEVLSLNRSCDEAIAHAACGILEQQTKVWIDLRRDALAPPNRYEAYRKPLTALLIAVLMFVLSIGVVAQLRGRAYSVRVAEALAQQRDAYREVFPESKRIPRIGVRKRLESEQRRLAGLGGEAAESGDSDSIQMTSALTQLHDVLANLPSNIRYRILDISIQPRLVRVDGQAQSHAQAEKLVVALQKSGRYSAEAPRTQTMREGGVSFLFTAERRTNTSSTQGAIP